MWWLMSPVRTPCMQQKKNIASSLPNPRIALPSKFVYHRIYRPSFFSFLTVHPFPIDYTIDYAISVTVIQCVITELYNTKTSHVPLLAACTGKE